MKNSINDDLIRRRIPKGCVVPKAFNEFIRAEPPFSIEWISLDRFSLKQSAEKEAVPFLVLNDGAVIAFWFCQTPPVIVHIGAHGELDVVAEDFEDFLKAINTKCSGLSDFDENEQTFSVPGVKGKPKRSSLPALQEQFDNWFKKHTSLLKPLKTSDTETLRQRVFHVAEEMLRDGLSKVYTLSSPWWSMNFKIKRNGSELSITYLDFGQWYPVPQKYELEEEVIALLKLVKNKKRKQYELSMCSAGIVSINNDRELVLVSPDRETE